MNAPQAIRWTQRFQNFEKAFNKLKETIDQFDSLDDLSKEGLIQRFEYTFELSWKTIKDFLEHKNVEAKYPRDTIKQAFNHELIDNEKLKNHIDEHGIVIFKRGSKFRAYI